jgi:hypothetical protein
MEAVNFMACMSMLKNPVSRIVTPCSLLKLFSSVGGI